MEITGIIQWVCALQTGTAKDGKQWSSREFVIEETGGQYPRDKFLFVAQNDVLNRCAFQIGDEVRLSFGISCRTYDKKDGTQGWFTTIRAYDATIISRRVLVNPTPDQVQTPEQQRAIQDMGNEPQSYNGAPF